MGLSDLSDTAVIVFDSSKGQLSAGLRKPGFRIYSAPFGNMAASELRRNIFKNTITFGVLGKAARTRRRASQESPDCPV